MPRTPFSQRHHQLFARGRDVARGVDVFVTLNHRPDCCTRVAQPAAGELSAHHAAAAPGALHDREVELRVLVHNYRSATVRFAPADARVRWLCCAPGDSAPSVELARTEPAANELFLLPPPQPAARPLRRCRSDSGEWGGGGADEQLAALKARLASGEHAAPLSPMCCELPLLSFAIFSLRVRAPACAFESDFLERAQVCTRVRRGARPAARTVARHARCRSLSRRGGVALACSLVRGADFSLGMTTWARRPSPLSFAVVAAHT